MPAFAPVAVKLGVVAQVAWEPALVALVVVRVLAVAATVVEVGLETLCMVLPARAAVVAAVVFVVKRNVVVLV